MLYRTWRPNEVLTGEERSVALGVFDGVHLGHRTVISVARNVHATFEKACPLVTVLSLTGVPKSGGRMLTSEQEQERAETLGVDEWLCVPFDSVRDMSPETFVTEVLHRRLNATVVTCGYNFRFGKGGAGDASLLKELGRSLGMEVRVVPAVEREGEPVSSTAVRRALEQGDPERAMRLLGRPYTVAFPVCEGNHLGGDWGIPTVNQPFPEGFVCPRFGVYASLVTLENKEYRAITNIGTHPTVGGTTMPQAETHIFGYSGDLYGKTPEVKLIRFLREERCFDSVDALRAQIETDREKAESVLRGDEGQKAILFDFDDTLQHRPHAFYATAVEMLERYFPNASAEKIGDMATEMFIRNNDGYVKYENYSAEICRLFDFPVEPQAFLDEYTVRFPFHSELYPDALSVLSELRRRGYRLGIVTNGESLMQNLKLDFVGLRTYMDVVLPAGDEGVQKPKPELYYRAAQRLCVSPQNCVFVGDYPPTDIAGALAAGMTPLYIDVYGRNAAPDGVERITSLTELLERY